MITFANGQTFDTVRIIGATETFQGQQRKTLAITFLASVITLAAAAETWKDEDALKELTVSSDGQTSVQLNFTLPVELTAHTLRNEDGSLYDVVTMKIAQKSALELIQETQAVDIENIEAALIELAEMEANNG